MKDIPLDWKIELDKEVIIFLGAAKKIMDIIGTLPKKVEKFSAISDGLNISVTKLEIENDPDVPRDLVF